jgi:hypothetical protein
MPHYFLRLMRGETWLSFLELDVKNGCHFPVVVPGSQLSEGRLWYLGSDILPFGSGLSAFGEAQNVESLTRALETFPGHR